MFRTFHGCAIAACTMLALLLGVPAAKADDAPNRVVRIGWLSQSPRLPGVSSSRCSDPR